MREGIARWADATEWYGVLCFGSAIQVMLATRFRATVGQNQTRKQGDQQQPCSSERRAQHVDQAGTRKMQTPPDLVVEFQPVDIVNVIL
jgi:hypothetical protein